MRVSVKSILTVALVLGGSSAAFAGDDAVWSVSKSSGEVWVTTSGAEQVSLTREEMLKPGDEVRTGPNGRVLLVRGEETILVAPNSVIGLPVGTRDGLATTILQRAGSILLEVEKKNIKHFEVETPYLAAVVKGTQFSVTVTAKSTRVSVNRGQVEVSDFKSGQIAQVMPGQVAAVLMHGKPGLSLSGSGTLNPIEQGTPRAPSFDRVQVPKGGLTSPQKPGDGKTIHALGSAAKSDATLASLSDRKAAGVSPVKPNVVHISTALGEVKLNVNKATHGLAHGSAISTNVRNNASPKDSASVWSDANTGASGGVAQGNSNSNSNAGSGGSATSTGSSTSAAVTSVVSPTASSGVAAATGVVNGATGNGNGGVGNGRGIGNLKH